MSCSRLRTDKEKLTFSDAVFEFTDCGLCQVDILMRMRCSINLFVVGEDSERLSHFEDHVLACAVQKRLYNADSYVGRRGRAKGGSERVRHHGEKPVSKSLR
jgi:hypothetical protein